MSNPYITIGLPVYNGARFLGRAVDSLLAQSFTDFELIIADNASTDDTFEIAQTYRLNDERIRVVRHPVNIGAARNWNSLVPMARGPFFKWASSNDYVVPTMLASCLEQLDSDSSLVLCSGRTVLVDDEDNVIGPYDGDVEAMQPRANERFTHICRTIGLNNIQSGLIRTEALRKTALERTYPGGDMVLVAELALLGKFKLLSQRVLYRRVDKTSFTRFLTTAALRDFWDPSSRAGGDFALWRLHADYVWAAVRSDLPLIESAKAAASAIRHASWKRAELWRELRRAFLAVPMLHG